MASKYLGQLQLRGLQKIGAVIAPGDGDFPSFADCDCVAQVDRVLEHMPASEIGDLKLLLTLLAFFPGFLVAALIGLLERAPQMRGPLAPLLRFVRLGIRGLVLTLYYSHPRVHAVLGYEVSVYTGDIGKSALQLRAIGGKI